MSADIFSIFDNDSQGGAQDDGGDPNVQTAFDDDSSGFSHTQAADTTTQADDTTTQAPDTTTQAPETGTQAADSVTIKKDEWDSTQKMLAEFRGFMAASQNRQVEPQRQADPQPNYQQQQYQQQNQQAQLDQFLSGVTEDLTSLDPVKTKAAVTRILQAGAQIGAAQAQQYVSPAATSTVDLMIENFVTRKSAKDPLYDKVAERFEQKIAKVDTRILAGYSRAQLNEALEEVYDAEAGRWAREQVIERQKKAATTSRQEPTNYGGGRGGGAGASRSKTVPEAYKKYALDAGIPEADITPELFKDLI